MINDNLLNKVATQLAADSYWMGFSTDTTISEDGSATALQGEIGSRSSCSNDLVDNVLTLNAQRPTTSVVDQANGDRLTMVGLFDASTNGTLLQMFSLPSLLHTTSFDLDIDLVITIDRG